MSQPNLYRHAAPPLEITRLQRKYLDWFKSTSGPVLDLGCGRGLFLDLLRDAGIGTVGVDASEAACDEARSKGHEVTQADVIDFLKTCAASSQAFGGVFCSHVIEHHDGANGRVLVEGIVEVLEPGGHCVIVTPNPNQLKVVCDSFWRDETHVRPFPASLLQQLFEESGLEVLSIGDDPDTRPTPASVGRLRWWASRLAMGDWFTQGMDLVAIGRKR